MKNNFLSKVTKMPQNTGGGNSQTKRATFALPLRYLCAMLLAFILGVGQMWGTTAKQGTYYLFYGTSVNTAGNNLNTSDFIFAKDYVVKTSVSPAKTIGDGSFTHYVTPKSYGATSVASADPEKIIIYNAKTSVTKLTLYIKNDRNGAKDYYIDHVFEGEKAATADRAYKKSFTKASENGGTDDCEKKEYTFTNTNKKNVSIYVMPGQDVRIYQAIVEETGDDLLDIGEDGYVLGGYRSGVKTTGAITFEGLEILSTSNKAILSGNIGVFTVSSSKPSGYMKFTTPNNGKYVLLTATHSSTKALQIEERASLPANTSGYSQLATAVAETKKKLSPNTTYMMFSINSGITMNTLTFSIPKVTYNANGGSETMAATEWTVAANGFTAPSGKKFDKWNTQADGEGKDVTVGTEVDANTNLFAIWKDDVAEYTVTYKDGGTTLKSVNVAVGSAPDAYSPTKDLYTFAAWQKDAADYDPADLASDAATNDEITLTARWTAQYTSGTYEFTGHLTMGTAPNQMVIENNSDGKDYTAGRIDNIYVSAQKIGYQESGDYGGWKLKTTNGTLRFMVENACGVRVTLGEANPLRIAYTEGGVAKTADIAKSTTSSVYKADANTLVTLTNITSGNKTVTLKKLEILPLYNATYTDGKGDASGSASNVTEVTLPTPSETTVGGYSFTGWVADKTVYKGETAKTAGSGLDAGETYTLTAKTAFTAQWQLISDFDVKFFQGYGDPDVQIGETQSISTGGYAVAPTDPVRDGYRFLGWSTDGTEANIVTVASYVISVATDFTAVWIQQFEVTFDGAGAVSVDNGATVASPDSPTKAGKIFQGWYNGESKYDFSATVTGNLALTSKWAAANPNHYVYAYNDDFHFDGVVYKTPEGKTTDPDANEATLDLTSPYTLFSGAEGITSIVATKAVYDYKKADNTKHITAYLKLKKSTDDANSKLTFTIASGYTAVLKVKMGGYSSTPTVTLKKGEETITAASGSIDGTAPGKNYGEITYNLTAGVYEMTTTGQTLYFSNIDLEATAIPAKTVTYHANNGTSDQTVDNNATEIATCSFSYAGHKFIGWRDGSDNAYEVGDVVSADLELYAQWKEYFTITYKDGETTLGTEDVFTDAAPAGIANPVKMGNNFAGWVDGENDPVTITSLNAATTVYAKWTAFDGCVELWPETSGEAPTAADEEIVLQSGSKGGRIVTVSAKSSDFSASFNYTVNGFGLMKGGDDVIGVTLNNEIAVGTKISVTLYSNNEGARGLILQTATGGKVGSEGVTLGWANATLGAVETFTYTAEAGDGLVGTNGFRLKRSNTVYLKCLRVESCGESIIYHEVTYDMMGHGVAPAKESVRENRLVTEPAEPEVAGYYFRGWYKENTFVNKWNFATDVMGTTDMTLYAKWEEDLCTDRQSIVKMVLTSPTEATVTGYNTKEYAGGFFTNNLNTGSGNTSAYDFGEGDVTGYKLAGTNSAVFATLAKGGFQEGDKVVIALTSAASSNKLEIYAAKDKDNTLLLGEVAAAAAGVYTYTITAANVTAIEAAGADYKSIGTIRGTYNPYVYSVELKGCRSWAIMHTLTFKNIDGSATIATENLAEGDFASTVAPAAPTVEDKRFIGWAETIDGTPVNLASYTITDDKTLYAVYGDCPTSGTVFKFTVATGKTNGNIFATTPNSMELTTENYLAELEGGSVVAAVSSSDNNRLQYYDGKALGFTSGSQGSLTLKLECPMAEGDLIRFINYANSGQKFSLKGDDHTETLDGNGAETVQTLSVPAEWDGLRELTLTRSNNTPKISYFEIYRRPALTGVSLADLTVREGASATPVMTLSPSADALVTSQAWSILSGDDKITISETTGEVTGVAQGDAEIKVVLNGDPAISATATVHVVESFVQQDVDEPIVWDFSKAGVVSSAFSEQVLANVDGVTLDASQFEATKLVGSANNITDTYFQGTMLTFNATKAGLLNVRFTNGNAHVRTLKVYVGDPEVEIASWSYSNAAVENKFIEVPAGKVTLRSYQETSPNNVRIMNLEFMALAHRRTAAYSVGELGTICLEDDAKAVGANVYELQGHDENGKMVFEQILSGEIEAGKPYLFQATNASQVSFYKKINATHADNAGSLKGMYGTFVDKDLDPETDVDMFYFSGTHIWAVKDFTVEFITIPAHRCYVDYAEFMENPVSSSTPLPGRKRMLIGVNGAPAVATGFENAAATDKPAKMLINGQLFILRGEKMYDAKGQLVK